MREVRLVALVRENSTQLVMYSLDTCVRYSTYKIIPIFKSQKGSMEALNFLVIFQLPEHSVARTHDDLYQKLEAVKCN